MLRRLPDLDLDLDLDLDVVGIAVDAPIVAMINVHVHELHAVSAPYYVKVLVTNCYNYLCLFTCYSLYYAISLNRSH